MSIRDHLTRALEKDRGEWVDERRGVVRRRRRGGARSLRPKFTLEILDSGEAVVTFLNGPIVRFEDAGSAERYVVECGHRWRSVHLQTPRSMPPAPKDDEKGHNGSPDEPRADNARDRFGPSRAWVRLLVNEERE